MKNNDSVKNHSQTVFIQLNSRNCKACWKCISVCRKEVINKIDFWFHKHARIKKPDNCVGCFRCVNICEFHAISLINQSTQIVV